MRLAAQGFAGTELLLEAVCNGLGEHVCSSQTHVVEHLVPSWRYTVWEVGSVGLAGGRL